MIKIENMSFSYKGNPIFKDFNLIVDNNELLSIVGLNGSGKTTLIKILCGILRYDGYISIDNRFLNETNLNNVRRCMGVIFSDIDELLIGETVSDDLAFSLENLEYSNTYIKNEIKTISNIFGINEILDKKIEDLNIEEKIMTVLGASLIHRPKVLIIDNVFNGVCQEFKEKIYKILINLKKENNMSIIIMTNNLEDTIKSDRILVLNKGEVYLLDKPLEIYKNEKKLNKLGFKLPFCVELSNYLILYDVLNKVYFDVDRLVNAIWK